MNLSEGQLTILIALITHGAATVWFASRVNTTLSFIAKKMDEFERLIVSEIAKKDKEISEIWKEINEIKKEIWTK